MFVVLFPANKSQANVLEQKKTYCLQSVLSSIDRTKEKKNRKHPNYKCYQILLSLGSLKSVYFVHVHTFNFPLVAILLLINTNL